MKLKNFSEVNLSLIDKEIKRLKDEKIINRIWDKDYKVWNNNPTEISNRLGWLDCQFETRKSFSDILSFVEEIKKEGFTQALLLGMGGSSLAPEVFSLVFGKKKGFLNLSINDSTHPEAILDKADKFDPQKTLYIVSTKSGGTVETMSFMKYFYNFAADKLGKEKVSRHFIAITDPGSGLEKIAKNLNFRKIFLNDPNIGGRFSALSLFGIIPAALIGVDIEKLFKKVDERIEESKRIYNDLSNNDPAMFGVILGALAKAGIDKLTIFSSSELHSIGAWIEQLIAESIGKEGKGILPVDLEKILAPDYYGKDRLFIYLKLKEDNVYNKDLEALVKSGILLIEIEVEDIYDLGKEFFKWEFATAIAGWSLGIQPFDQPNVEQAKVIARNILKQYHDKGKLELPSPTLIENGVKIVSDLNIKSLKNSITTFLEKCESGKSYVTLQAYVKPTEENFNILQEFRSIIQRKYKVATTLGFGPRFLHSTGQLHKGDSGNGYFIQFIDDSLKDAPIPDNPGEDKSSISFGILIKAQAYGDRQALLDNNRMVITFELDSDLKTVLSEITPL